MRPMVAALLYGSVGAVLSGVAFSLHDSRAASDSETSTGMNVPPVTMAPLPFPGRIECATWNSRDWCTFKFSDGVRCMWVADFGSAHDPTSRSISCVATGAAPMPPNGVALSQSR